jgi:hypothetical protein
MVQVIFKSFIMVESHIRESKWTLIVSQHACCFLVWIYYCHDDICNVFFCVCVCVYSCLTCIYSHLMLYVMFLLVHMHMHFGFLHASTCAQCHLWCFLLWMCLHRFFFLCAFAHAQWHLLFHVFIFSFHNWSIKSKLTMEENFR